MLYYRHPFHFKLFSNSRYKFNFVKRCSPDRKLAKKHLYVILLLLLSTFTSVSKLWCVTAITAISFPRDFSIVLQTSTRTRGQTRFEDSE